MSSGDGFVEIEGIGPVLFQRSQRALKLIIYVKSSRDVRVAVPRGMKFQKAVEFTISKRDWVVKHQSRLEQSEKARREVENTTPPIDAAVARRKLKARLSTLARRHDFSYHRVFIRRQRTRWGSCSAQNNISLNVRLVTLPERLMDYVLLHELTHTRIKNHSAGFWRELDKYVGNAKAEAAKLRTYASELPSA